MIIKWDWIWENHRHVEADLKKCTWKSVHSYSNLFVGLDVSVNIKSLTYEILVTNHRKKLLEKVENSWTTIFKKIYLNVQVGAKDS